MDAVPADRVDEELGALQQLLHQQLLVGAVQGVGPAEVGGEGGLDRGRVVADADPVGAGAVERFDHDRGAAALGGPGDRLAGARRLQRFRRAQAGGAQRFGHRVLVAPRGALGAAVGGQAEPLAERVGQRHAGLGADDDEGRVVGGEPRRGRLEVALVDDVLDEIAGAEGAQVELGQAAGCSARGRPAGRRRQSAVPAAPRSSRRRRRPLRRCNALWCSHAHMRCTHAVPTRTSRSSGRFGPPAKLP